MRWRSTAHRGRGVSVAGAKRAAEDEQDAILRRLDEAEGLVARYETQLRDLNVAARDELDGSA